MAPLTILRRLTDGSTTGSRAALILCLTTLAVAEALLADQTGTQLILLDHWTVTRLIDVSTAVPHHTLVSIDTKLL